MHNELIKIKIRDKFKLLKLCKLKYIHTTNPIFSKTKPGNKNNHNETLWNNFIQKKLCKKYNILPEKYSLIQIDNFIKAKYCHTLLVFKENLIFHYNKEFMKKFFNKTESVKKISLFAEFYKTYLQFFCSPTLKELKLNELIEERVETKAMAFYKQNYEEKKDDNNKENKNILVTDFFTSQIRKDISRKNTLTDLSKTTIGLYTNSDKNYSNSNKSINSLINEMNKNINNIDEINNKEYNNNLLKRENNKNLTDRNIKKDDLLKKNLFTSLNNLIPKESKLSLIKKVPKIKLNINFINNKISKTNTEKSLFNKNITYIKNDTSNSINSIHSNKSKINTMNKTKPMYHKINIVNNKIIIINNNSKSKKNLMKQITSKELINKKSKKKKNLTLLTRNDINDNNLFGSFYGNTYDIINSQDKIMKIKNINTSISIKTFNQEKKASYRGFNSSKNNNIKTMSKINHIKKIKEKNLILKSQKFKNIHTDNNILNTNLFSNYLTGAKTERNISKGKTTQRWTNFQMFNNNIKSINRIKHIKDISNDKYSSKNIKSTNSIMNKTNKIKNILKLSTVNTIEIIKKIHNKSKNVLKTSKTKIKKNNSKFKTHITNNKDNIINIYKKK